MKITNVYTEKYKWPKEKPIANGTHVFTHNELNLLVIETDEGITGYGKATVYGVYRRLILHYGILRLKLPACRCTA